jgi:hypothetical protein
MAPEKQRALTPEEKARRTAVMGGGEDPMKIRVMPPAKVQVASAPVESLPQRITRARTTVKPAMIDYDRDGYPDSIVGRSQRNLTERALARGSGGRPVIYGGRPGLGMDSYRQDQIGYRDRIRGMLAAVVELNKEDGEGPTDARTLAMSKMPVGSHAGTGVPGGIPDIRYLPGRQVMSRVPRYTPSQQAQMAPRTMPTGIPRNPAQRAAPAQQAEVTPMATSSATFTRRTQGQGPEQGQVATDGSFKIASGAPSLETMSAGTQAKAPEQPKPAHQAQPTHQPTHQQPAQPSKAPEHHRPPEQHKPPEHKK